MISHHCIETAYCFFHQKERVYAHSNMEWQREDIEYAIALYVEEMNPELLHTISGGNPHFLREHCSFHAHLQQALDTLEALM